MFLAALLSSSIIGIIVFIIGWIYAIATFGFFIGLGVGWIPALFIAKIADFLSFIILGAIGYTLEKRDLTKIRDRNIPQDQPKNGHGGTIASPLSLSKNGDDPNRSPRPAPTFENTRPSMGSTAPVHLAIGLIVFIGLIVGGIALNERSKESFPIEAAPEFSAEAPPEEAEYAPEPVSDYQTNFEASEPIVENSVQPNVVLPDFAGAQSDYSLFKTRITNAMLEGPDFFNNYKFIIIGCGTGCKFVYLGNTSNGELHDFPYGGEDYQQMSLDYKLDSTNVNASWFFNGQCVNEQLQWNGVEFQVISHQTMPDESC